MRADAETIIAAALCQTQIARLRLADIVTADDFGDARLAEVARAVGALDAARRPINRFTLAGALDGKVTGAADLIAALVAQVVDLGTALHFAEGVRDAAMLRRVATVASRIAAAAAHGNVDPGEFADRAQREIIEAAARRRPVRLTSVQAAATRVVDDLEERGRAGKAVTGTPSGLRGIDDVTGGFHPGHLDVWGARPGVGKTALMMTCGRHAAAAGFPVYVQSIEMPADQLVARALCVEGGLTSAGVKMGVRGGDALDARRAEVRVRGWAADITIDDTPGPTIEHIRTQLRLWRAEHPGQAVAFLDYLQLVHVPPSRFRKEQTRERDVASITAGLKGMAKELRLPIVALSQLKRPGPGQRGKALRPTLADLRESGAIEQDADLVALLFREEMHGKVPPERKGVTDFDIAKHRHGETKLVQLRYAGSRYRFTDYHTDPEQRELVQ